MVKCTLYIPGSTAKEYNLSLPALPVGIPSQVPLLLGCSPGLVDVLATGNGFVAYSIFDYEGLINFPAMQVLAHMANITFDPGEEEDCLMGPILILEIAVSTDLTAYLNRGQ